MRMRIENSVIGVIWLFGGAGADPPAFLALTTMARYEHLPIYKTAMDLAVYLEQVVRNFSCYHKYTLGSDLRQQSRELVTLIIRANSRREKGPVLEELRECRQLESRLAIKHRSAGIKKRR